MSYIRKLFRRNGGTDGTLPLPERLPYNNAIAIEALVSILVKKEVIDREELLEEVKRLARQMKENASKLSEKKSG